MLKRWCSIKEIEVYLLCENFDFKRYTPRPKKLNIASLLKTTYVSLFSISIVSSWRTKYKSYLSNYKRSGFWLNTILSDKLPKTVLCVPQSAQISSFPNFPDTSLIIFNTSAWKLPKSFLWGNLSKMPE